MDDIKEVRNQAVEISELVEDAVSHYCNENRVSGQRAWFFVSHLLVVLLPVVTTIVV